MSYEILVSLVGFLGAIISIVTVFTKKGEKTINAINDLKIEMTRNNTILNSLNSILQNVVGRTDVQEQHLNGLDLKVSQLEQKVNELEKKVDKLEKKVTP